MPNDTTTITDGQSSPRSPELQVGLDLIAEATAVHRRMVELLAEAPPEVHEQVIEQVRPMLEANVRSWRELVEEFASRLRHPPTTAAKQIGPSPYDRGRVDLFTYRAEFSRKKV